MVLNNFVYDFKRLMLETGKTQIQLAKETGKAQSNISRTMGNIVINEQYAMFVHALGYDMKVEYIKR